MTLLVYSTCYIMNIETKGIELLIFSRVNFDTMLNYDVDSNGVFEELRRL